MKNPLIEGTSKSDMERLKTQRDKIIRQSQDLSRVEYQDLMNSYNRELSIALKRLPSRLADWYADNNVDFPPLSDGDYAGIQECSIREKIREVFSKGM